MKLKPVPRIARRILGRAWRTFPGLPVPYRLPWGGWLLLRLDGTGLSLLDGTYPEQAELDWLRRMLRVGMVFFDIGANQGVYSVVAAKAVGQAGRVYAFEPVPSELKKLRANIRFNRLRNVVVESKAVGAYEGETQMYACEPRKGGFSSLRPPADHLNLKWSVMTVPIVSLDTYVQQMGIRRIDYLKVDVEGGERDAIAGAVGILSGGNRPVVQIEFADGRTEPWGYKAREIASDLAKYGYTWFELENGGLVPHQLREQYQYEDLVAVPVERLNEAKDLMAKK